MIPEISTTTLRSQYVDPAPQDKDMLSSISLGGDLLSTPTTGELNIRQWIARCVDGEVTLSTEGQPDRALRDLGEDVTQISLAFDQQMQPFLAYTKAGRCYFWYFDTALNAMTTMMLPEDAKYPYILLDDKRSVSRAGSDVILTYMRGTTLCALVQRERYLTEHQLATLPDNVKSVGFGMGSNYRLQWRFKPI